jgi:hypothetical protein
MHVETLVYFGTDYAFPAQSWVPSAIYCDSEKIILCGNT